MSLNAHQVMQFLIFISLVLQIVAFSNLKFIRLSLLVNLTLIYTLVVSFGDHPSYLSCVFVIFVTLPLLMTIYVSFMFIRFII